MSNHSAIFVKLNLENVEKHEVEQKSQEKVMWDNTSLGAIENYKDTLDMLLSDVHLPECINCKDLRCNDHKEEIDEYILSVLDSVQVASKECLPISGKKSQKKKNKTIPGWSEYVKPFSEDSNFWSSVWISAGRPKEGNLFTNMKKSKQQYKYSIRRLKKCNEIMERENFLESLLSSSGDIFKEIRRFRGKAQTVSSKIDNATEATAIANVFAEKYKNLYNNRNISSNHVLIESQIDVEISNESMKTVEKIDTNVVKEALKKMKPNKHDNVFITSSNCYTEGPSSLVEHLKNMIHLILVHGYIPQQLLLCSLYPLVKDKFGDITESDNYRAIGGGNLLLKLLDLVFIGQEEDKLDVNELQFAYQKGVSTTTCSLAVKTVVDHFTNRKKVPLFGAAMDMSKAFDKCDWKELFPSLLKRKSDPLFLRVIFFIYKEQVCIVCWNGSFSFSFKISNSVRQGMFSSAFFFIVYINELITIIKRSRIGCYIDSVCVAIFIFADDIFLLSANRSGLQTLVTLCEDFARERNLSFGTNPDPSKSKTKCIIFSKKKIDNSTVAPIVLNENNLPLAQNLDHLGVTLQSDNSMQIDIKRKRAKFIGKVHSLIQELHFATPEVLLKIISSNACSFFGSVVWDLEGKDCDRLFKSWNVMIRLVFSLNRRTHRSLIEGLSGHIHLMVMLYSRLQGFHESLKQN